MILLCRHISLSLYHQCKLHCRPYRSECTTVCLDGHHGKEPGPCMRGRDGGREGEREGGKEERREPHLTLCFPLSLVCQVTYHHACTTLIDPYKTHAYIKPTTSTVKMSYFPWWTNPLVVKYCAGTHSGLAAEIHVCSRD